MPSPGPHDLARTLPRDAFLKVFGTPFLVVTDTGDDEPPSSFETVDAASTPRPLPGWQRGVEVHPIAKAKENPYRERISVGRAPNCDVVLRYASVSKLHGYFRAREGGGLEFVDVGSMRGSRVNGRPVEAGKAVPVPTGALLLLGRVAARMIGPGAVWDLLQAQERIHGAGA
jgi:hypothetical protein